MRKSLRLLVNYFIPSFHFCLISCSVSTSNENSIGHKWMPPVRPHENVLGLVHLVYYFCFSFLFSVHRLPLSQALTQWCSFSRIRRRFTEVIIHNPRLYVETGMLQGVTYADYSGRHPGKRCAHVSTARWRYRTCRGLRRPGGKGCISLRREEALSTRNVSMNSYTRS